MGDFGNDVCREDLLEQVFKYAYWSEDILRVDGFQSIVSGEMTGTQRQVLEELIDASEESGLNYSSSKEDRASWYAAFNADIALKFGCSAGRIRSYVDSIKRILKYGSETDPKRHYNRYLQG